MLGHVNIEAEHAVVGFYSLEALLEERRPPRLMWALLFGVDD